MSNDFETNPRGTWDRLLRLEAALWEYGEHNPKCGKWDKMDSGQLFARHDWKCTCGFDEALDKEQT